MYQLGCTIGMFSLARGTACTACTAGKYCFQTETGLLAPSPASPVLAETDCPIGFFCKTGEHLKLFQPCPVGYIRATVGATDF